jgi:hypothetical protein
VEILLGNRQQSGGAQRDRIGELRPHQIPAPIPPESRKPRSEVPQRHGHLNGAVKDSRIEKRRQRAEKRSGTDQQRHAGRLDRDHQDRGEADVSVREHHVLEERGRQQEQRRQSNERSVVSDLRGVEYLQQQSRPEREQQPRQRAYQHVHEQDVERHLALASRFARQEVESAHREAEREDRHDTAGNQERLLVQPELRQAHLPHENDRKQEARCERQGFRSNQPDSTLRQRAFG